MSGIKVAVSRGADINATDLVRFIIITLNFTHEIEAKKLNIFHFYTINTRLVFKVMDAIIIIIN